MSSVQTTTPLPSIFIEGGSPGLPTPGTPMMISPIWVSPPPKSWILILILEPHLTNVAIQKKTEGYKKEGFGGKWDLRHLKLYMLSRYGEEKVNECFRKIQDLIIHTYNSV